MENFPLISVIVPVYKAEAYLDFCVASILNQTYKNLEIILVDDGSPDGCPKKCDEWAKRDSRVFVIHKENAGSAAARNTALDAANGELIAFVDSDDYISSDMYEYLFSLLKDGADIAECGFVNVTGNNADFGGDEASKVFSSLEAMKEHILDRLFRQLVWNKLYKKEVLNGVRFPVGKKIDDEFFTYRAIGNAKKLVCSPKACYAYRQHSQSLMHSMGATVRLQAVEAKEERHKYILEHFPSLSSASLKNLWFTCIYQGQLALSSMSKDEKKKAFDYLSSVLSRYPIKEKNDFSVKEKLWLFLAEKSLKKTCGLRNFLKIGI